MIAVVIVLAIVAGVLIKMQSSGVPSRTPAASSTRPPMSTSPQQSPTFFNSGAVGNIARQISSLIDPNTTDPPAPTNQVAQVAKPQLIIVQYNPQVGNIDFITQYATHAQGIGYDKSVLFDTDVKDGPGSASFKAGVDIDYINVMGPGGINAVANYLKGTITPSTNSPSDVLVPPSLDLSSGPTVLPSPLTAGNLYPAASDNWLPSAPVEKVLPNDPIVSI